MKNKVLTFKYDDNSASQVVRIYTTEYFEQAGRDLSLLQEHASDCKKWELHEVEVYSPKEKEQPEKENQLMNRSGAKF